MSGQYEYRVSWKRDGWRPKSKRFARLFTATRYAGKLVAGDPHWRCDEGHGFYDSDGPDREWRDTCMPEIVTGPVIERRSIGEWESSAGTATEDAAKRHRRSV